MNAVTERRIKTMLGTQKIPFEIIKVVEETEEHKDRVGEGGFPLAQLYSLVHVGALRARVAELERQFLGGGQADNDPTGVEEAAQSEERKKGDAVTILWQGEETVVEFEQMLDPDTARVKFPNDVSREVPVDRIKVGT